MTAIKKQMEQNDHVKNSNQNNNKHNDVAMDRVGELEGETSIENENDQRVNDEVKPLGNSQQKWMPKNNTMEKLMPTLQRANQRNGREEIQSRFTCIASRCQGDKNYFYQRHSDCWRRSGLSMG